MLSVLNWLYERFWCMLWPTVKVYIVGIIYLLKEWFWSPCAVACSAVYPTNAGERYVAVITGGNRGIGSKVSELLAVRYGFRVVICGLDAESGTETCCIINSRCDEPLATFETLDLSSFSSIDAFCHRLSLNIKTVHLLINNAGVMMTPFWKSENNMEYQWSVNVVGPFYLTRKLLPAIQSASQDCFGRIVNVSSSTVHAASPVEFAAYANAAVAVPCAIPENLYSGSAAYFTSKAAINLLTKLLQQKLDSSTAAAENRIRVSCLHPGVVWTDLYSHVPAFVRLPMKMLRFLFRNVSDAAADVVYVALADEIAGGSYYQNGVSVNWTGNCGVNNKMFEEAALLLFNKLDVLVSSLVVKTPSCE